MTTSILIPTAPSEADDVLPFAALVAGTRAERLWQGQTLGIEVHQAFAYAAGHGQRVPVGTSVTLAALRHPFEAALEARSLAAITGHGLVFGVGPGTGEFVGTLRGSAYASPLTAMREYLTILRDLLDGREVDRAGRYHAMHGALVPLKHPPVALGLGVLRPAMARLAGEIADVAITWLTPPEYVRDVLAPALAEGAADRPRPRVATVVHAAVDRPGRDLCQVVLNATRNHLSAPHYVDMLRRAGLRVHHTQPSVGARLLVRSGTFLHGTPEQIRDGIRRYRDAGVDEVIINTVGVGLTDGLSAAADDLADVLADE
ncbi:LLM class flavin-dependent oxidoreductase [Micromonospora sp. DT53]|uniref:LLM class flavin-dependent oxidoreductase n=1 Tax=Micromonospora sp. DT53 TaxID=3393444 RepID=UPI003CE9544C